MRTTVLFVILAAAVILAIPSTAAAQEQCLAFHGVIQAELLPDDILRPDDVWGGTVYAYLGDRFLTGRYSGNNGTYSTPHGVAASGKGGTDYFDFGDGNTFEAEQMHATFPAPPGQVPNMMGGIYNAADKLVGGQRAFAKATGSLSIRGPWVVWDGGWKGRWNGEVDGKICGVDWK